MKNFDYSILIPLLGGAVLAYSAHTALEPLKLIIALAVLMFMLFIVALVRFSRINILQSQSDKLEKQLAACKTEHEQQLSDMQIELEKKHTAFFSEISHSLRMPVSIIQGYAEMMQNGDLDPVTESEYINKIVLHTHRISDTLSNHLDGTTKDTVAESPKTSIDLISAVKNQLNDLAPTAESYGVSLQLVAFEESLPVSADPRLLRRILFNLAENSFKYMGREGMVTVLIAKEENMVRVTVRDDGLGLPEKEVEQLFEANFRGSNSSNEKGSGYGLYLVKQAVESQGGCISASSQPGRGMSISFQLPLAQTINA